MLVLVTGAPGAGKGTQSDLLVERYRFKKVSTGDALRHQIAIKSDLGLSIEQVVSSGNLVSDDILFEVIRTELSRNAGDNVLLDGYPRNMTQVGHLDSISDRFPVDVLIHLDVPRELLIARLVGRRICLACGTSYHIEYKAPTSGVCEKCGGVIAQRDDDKEDRVQVRLNVYDSSTKPILDHYKGIGKYIRVDGSDSVDVIFGRIESALGLARRI